MAPPSNSAKALQQNRPRPVVPKTVVPAIPLPFLQKRKQQVAVREQAKEEPALVHAIVLPSLSPTSPVQLSQDIANASSESIVSELGETVTESAPSVLPVLSPMVDEPVERRPEESEASKEVGLGKCSMPIYSMTISLTSEIRAALRNSIVGDLRRSVLRIEVDLPYASCILPCEPQSVKHGS